MADRLRYHSYPQARPVNSKQQSAMHPSIDDILQAGSLTPDPEAPLPEDVDRGVLIPLKTTLELRDDHVEAQAFITRTPLKAANGVVKYVAGFALASRKPTRSMLTHHLHLSSIVRSLVPEGGAKNLTHLRRCAKPSDLPAHLKSQFMNETANDKQIHTGKSNWIYVILALDTEFTREELFEALESVEGIGDDIFIASIPIPLLAPTSQVQAAMWSQQFWPTVYRKNNPLGPHPSMVVRATDEINKDTDVWMQMAHRVARKAFASGHGEPIGAVVVQRTQEKINVVAVAGDARWLGHHNRQGTGNAMAHSVLRAISMVAQKLVLAENEAKNRQPLSEPELAFEGFQDRPLLDDEEAAFNVPHPSPDGYLCHGLELYLTHEPCIMCSMAILHSRMGKVVFCRRMPLTGGLCSEDRGHGDLDLVSSGAGRGLGLFWRRELNWSLLAWEWEASRNVEPLPAPPRIHA